MQYIELRPRRRKILPRTLLSCDFQLEFSRSFFRFFYPGRVLSSESRITAKVKTEHRIPFQVDVIGEFHGAVVASKSAKEQQSNLHLLGLGIVDS